MEGATGVSETVRALAETLLTKVDDLTDELVEEILGSDERYAGTVPTDDLRRSVADNLDKIIRALAGRADDPRRHDPPRETGRRRAEQGLPVESLLHSYRVGGRLIWKRMVELTRTEAPERLDDLLDGATQVWDAIDEYSNVVGESYRATEARLARIDLHRQASTVEALLEGGASTTVMRRAADLLGSLDRLVVVAVEEQDEADARGVSRVLRAHGIRAAWQLRPPGLIGVLSMGDKEVEGLRTGLAQCVEGRAGASLVVSGVRELPAAHEQAEIALRLAGPAPSVALLRDHLRAATVLAAGRLGSVLEEQVLGEVDRLPGAEAASLLETIEAYVELGAVSAVAQRLHCHRNTVLNRLKRVSQLTGLDLAVPGDLASLVLALDARGGQSAVEG